MENFQQFLQQGFQQVQQGFENSDIKNFFQQGVQQFQNLQGGSRDKRRYNVHINTWDDDNQNFSRAVHEKIREQNLWSRDVDSFYYERDGDSFTRSACNGNKKALFIGINYTGTQAELKGCINDVRNISELVCRKFGFQNCLYLTDEQSDPQMRPTYDNILDAMKWLVEGAQPNDSLFFHYSGHGGTARDPNNEEVDGFNETILPLDYNKNGQILDDVIYDHLVKPLPKGCRLTAIFDSCHSGTVMDLPYTYQCDGQVEVIENDLRKAIFQKALSVVGSFIQGGQANIANALLSIFDGSINFSGNSQAQQQQIINKRKHDADVIQFSGCRDNQTSADAKINNVSTGAMSYAFITVMNQNDNITYTQLLTQIRQIMKQKRFSQIPQLSSSHPRNMNEQFIM